MHQSVLFMHATDTQSAAEQNASLTELQLWAIEQSYYGAHVRNRWPLLTSNDDNDDATIIHKDYELLAKTEKKLTMVFIVGIEGTGHHFFRSIFDALQKHDSARYVHQNDRPWPQDPLWLIMDECWAYNLWGNRKPASWLTVDRSMLPSDEQSELALCSVVQKRINEYSSSLRNNSVLFMSTHYSFPYDDAVIHRYADFVQLIQFAQNAKPHAFDVRVLVLRRDYKAALISTCVKRFGECGQRIPLLANMLNVIHQQLQQIDEQFWIQINHTHMVQHSTEYAPIFSQFFNVKLEAMQQAIKETMAKYNTHKRNSGKNTHTMKKNQMNAAQLQAIQQSFYSDHVKRRWPYFEDPGKNYSVSPQNDTFLRAKHFYHRTEDELV